jgi:hypothetical protein
LETRPENCAPKNVPLVTILARDLPKKPSLQSQISSAVALLARALKEKRIDARLLSPGGRV